MPNFSRGEKMRVALIVDWHSEKMGYSDNFLPKALASLGHEVHLITSNGQIYFTSSSYKDIFEPFLGPAIVDCGIKQCDGYTLHRLPSMNIRGRVHIKGLAKKLWFLRPHIVQAGEFICLTTYESALLKPILGYKFFVECHVHASVFPAANGRGGIKERFYWSVYAATIGRMINIMAEKCYPISSDSADIINRFFGIHKNKIKIRPLGVDTGLFKPLSDDISKQKRSEFRKKLGFSDTDIVCIYTGRFDTGKNPLCLGQAIGKLVERGEPFRGLFIGNGTQSYIEDIKACSGCVVHPFVHVRELPAFYQASDIGVWPRQESTSQLDAAACGLPLILSNRVKVRERIEGSGLAYEEDNAEDLAIKLLILKDSTMRSRMGACGTDKMRKLFSWDNIAKQYIEDYTTALKY